MTPERLEAAAAQLARARPAVIIDLDTFRDDLANREGLCLDEVVEVEELMHCFACLRRDSAAIALFYARYEQPLRRVIARTCKDPDDAEDVFHDVVIKLTLARAHAPPGLRGYEGRGKLLTWLRVVAARAAIDHARKTTPSRLTHSMVETLEQLDLDPDTVASYRHDFKDAVALAVAALAPRQRQILRYHLAGVSVGDIAVALGHHRVTVSRWLSAIREQLRESTLRTLEQREAGAPHPKVPLDELLAHVSASFDRLLAPG